MQFSTADADTDNVLSEINMVPLIDVMLVLLVVFIITVPVIQHAVQVQLPQATSQARPETPATEKLSVSATGQYHWNGQAVSDAELEAHLAQAATQQPQPQLHIRGDRAVRYERVAQAMAAAQRSGIQALAFVTEP